MRLSTVRADGAAVNPLPFAAIPYTLIGDQRLTGTAVRLVGVLLKYCQRSDRCWPSVATLAGALGCCERTVQYALKRLKEAGWLRDEPAPNPTSRVLVLTWREGGCKPPREGGCKPYSQGLPRPRATPVAPEGEDPEKKKVAPPRKREREATKAEVTELFQGWLEYPPGHLLYKLARRAVASAPERPPEGPRAP